MTMSDFDKDLNESQKTVSFISSFLLNEGVLNFIEPRIPCEDCLHPPDIVILSNEKIYIEIKEDAMSLKTNNIFLEHRTLKEFSKVCVKEKAIPLLCYIPYVNPKPLLFLLSDDFRLELEDGIKEGIVKTVSGGDKGGLGYIIEEKTARLMTSCLTTTIMNDSQIQSFKEQFISERFVSTNHFFMKYANFE